MYPLDLNTRIHAELGQGRSIDDVVAGLVARGLSEPNARRIVERAASAPPPQPAEAAAAHGEADSGVKELVIGAFFFSLGTAVTALTYALAKPGGKFTLAYGAIIGGFVSIVRGLRRFEPARSTFPTVAFIAALLLPVLGGGILYQMKRPLTAEERAGMAEAEEARARRDQARAAEEKTQRETAERARRLAEFEKTGAAGVDARTKMMSPNPAARCEGARWYGDHKMSEGGDELERLFETDPDLNVRRCALDALIDVGLSIAALHITERALAPYESTRSLAVYAFERLSQDPDEKIRLRAAEGLERLKRVP